MKETDNSTVKGRLRLYVINHKRQGITAFEHEIGLPQGFTSRDGKSFSESTLRRVAERCEDLSINWLLTGKGPMILGGGINVINEGVANQVAGNVNNMGEMTNITNNYDSDCEGMSEEKADRKDDLNYLRGQYDALARQNESLHKENQKLLEIISVMADK